jgi:ribosome-binding factor A
MYTVPQLAFVYDDSIESGIALSRLIDEAVAEDAKHPHDD